MRKITFLFQPSLVLAISISFASLSACFADTDTNATNNTPQAQTSDSPIAEKRELSPPKSSLWATLGMVRQLSRQHYAKVPMNDELSERLLNEYVDSLDPARIFLLKSDIDSFQAYRHKLDNGLKLGNVSAAFAMYERLDERAQAQLQHQIDKLPKTIANFDFTEKEYLARDPKTQPWATDTAELDDRWRKRIKNDVLSLKLADKDDTDIIELIEKRLKRQLERFQEVNSEDVYTRYMNAYAGLYDPHTSHFSPRRHENFDINMSRSLEGIGAVLTRDEEFTKVLRLVTGGPADQQGDLKPSDRILGVAQDGEELVNVVGWRLDEVVGLIRGDKDTLVHLQVASKKDQANGTNRMVTIKRGKVELKDQLAKSEVIEIYHNDKIKRVGIISVPDFYADMEAQSKNAKEYRSVTRDVANIIETLKQDNIEGIVIDLRNNGGGSLTEANNLTSLFIGGGPTVQIRRDKDNIFPQGRYRGKALYEGPLVVLINRLSASASEIFAGAIQDYDRGIVVGTTSFGKGTVQTIVPLKDGAVKLTTAKFYRVSGQSTQYRGVEPDIHFPQIFDPEEVGESAYDNALIWDEITPISHNDFDNVGPVLSQLQAMHYQRISNDPDFIFYEKEFELSMKQKNDQMIPLQMAERQAKQQRAEQEFLLIENERRKTKGLEPLASLDDLEEDTEENEDDAEQTEASEEEEKSYLDDAFAVEASNILLDQISLHAKAQQLSLENQQAATAH